MTVRAALALAVVMCQVPASGHAQDVDARIAGQRQALALPAALPGRPSALAPKQSRTRVPRTFTRPAGGGELTSLRIHPFTKSRNHLQIT